jgi:hypothetical protein
MAWYAKEVVRSMFVYEITGQQLAVEFADQLAESLQDPEHPVEVRFLGRTIERWKTQITAWHNDVVYCASACPFRRASAAMGRQWLNSRQSCACGPACDGQV